MKGGETVAYTTTHPRNTPHGTIISNQNKKGPMKNKENLWCNSCKRRGHVKETCWKLQGRAPQAHMIAHSTPCDMYGGQQWMPRGPQWTQNGINPTYGAQTSAHIPNPRLHAHPPNQMHLPLDAKNMQQQIQNLQHQMQHLVSNTTPSG